jgi:hypothetical protein
MLSRWRSEHAVIVARIVSQIINGTLCVNDYRRELTKQTYSLPVYVGWGATILLTTSGELITYDDSTRQLSSEEDEMWQKAALLTMARDFPDLASLLPPRPRDAADCTACHGAGAFPEAANALCGECGGLGWIDRVEPERNG